MRRWLGVMLAVVWAVVVALPAGGAEAAAPKKKPAAASAKGKKPPVEAAPEVGTVLVLSTTEGASVLIDGKVVGTVPMDKPVELPVGEHTITVSKDGWTSYADTFTVTAEEETELEIDLIPANGFLKLQTDRPGASVKVGDKVVGVTPYDADVPVGKTTVIVSRPGFKEHRELLDVMPGQTYALDVTLVPIAEPSGSVVTKWWFWTLIGVAVAGGTTAAVLATQGGETRTLTPHFHAAVD